MNQGWVKCLSLGTHSDRLSDEKIYTPDLRQEILSYIKRYIY